MSVYQIVIEDKTMDEDEDEQDLAKDSSDILSMLEGNASETLEEIKKYFNKENLPNINILEI